MRGGTWWYTVDPSSHRPVWELPTGLPSPPGSCLVFSGTFFPKSLSMPMPIILSHLLLGSLRNYAGIQGLNKAMQNSQHIALCSVIYFSFGVCKTKGNVYVQAHWGSRRGM